MEGLTRPRIVCVGANLESRVALEGLLNAGANVVGLVTAPQEKRQTISDYVDLRPMLERTEVEVVESSAINDAVTLKAISDLKPDFIFTLGWSELFKKELLSIPTRYVVGSHPSALPAGRGRAPVAWTILERLRESAVTLFRMSPGVDDGPILLQKWFDVPENVYASDLYGTIASNLRDAYCELYRQIEEGVVVERRQDPTQASYRAKREPRDGHLDFYRSTNDLHALVRAVSDPYPGAYTYYNGQVVKIWRASVDNVPAYKGSPGQILVRSQQGLLVQGGDGPLWVEQFTINGEKADPGQFRIGSRFGLSLEDELFELRKEVRELRELLNRK